MNARIEQIEGFHCSYKVKKEESVVKREYRLISNIRAPLMSHLGVNPSQRFGVNY